MSTYAKDFGPFNDHVWLNASAHGPLPRMAVEAAREAISWHISPHLLTEDRFRETPLRLKRNLSRLIGAPAEDIILGNSTSYGLHLLANGIPWKKGDEVLCVKGDFPASVLPWLGLRKRGVVVREIKPAGPKLTSRDVETNLSKATKLLCATWVDSFTGHALDLKAIGDVCRANRTWFVLNGTQAIGARSLDVSATPVDAVSCCGYKWLCGPYATGFCWMVPELLNSLEYNQAYWLTMHGDRDLNKMRDYQIRTDAGAATYDVFCQANLLNFVPWTASVDYLLSQGIAQIQKHNDRLVEGLIKGLDAKNFAVLSPIEPKDRTAIVIISHRHADRNPALFEVLKRERIDISLREGNLRFSPHLYNTPVEIDYAVSMLNRLR